MSRYIISPLHDWLLILLPPVVGLGITFFLFSKAVSFSLVNLWGEAEAVRFGVFLNRLIIQSHIILVFFRSHLNGKIFWEHPVRFLVVPLLLFLSISLSDALLMMVAVGSCFWDYFHSGLQSFGISRIYDARVGNDPHIGRGWDIALNHFIYFGAIVAGINFIPSFLDSMSFRGQPTPLWKAIEGHLMSAVPYIQIATATAAVLFMVFYLRTFWGYKRQGYRFSLNKWIFLGITAAVNLYAWLTIPLIFALFVVNFYHSVQYFAIVWWQEKRNIQSLLGLGLGLSLLIFIAIGASYGFAVTQFKHFRWIFCIVLVCSVMHFWYDGFVWSVRRKQV